MRCGHPTLKQRGNLMATIISGQTTTFNVNQNNEAFFVPEGDFIASNSRAFEFLGFDNIDLIIAGQVVSEAGNFGVTLGSGATDNSIVVLASGSITAAADSIRNFGGDTVIINFGTIASTTFANTTNDGISTNNTGTVVQNHGMITANGSGINALFGSGSVKITNSGLISSSGLYGIGIRDSALISNSGEVVGFEAGIRALTAERDTVVVRNSGYIGSLGDAPSYQVGDTGVGTDRIFNSNKMDGDVLLGGGNDLYHSSAAGKVIGSIALGDGDDTMRGGDEAEDASFGQGNDLGYGNAGDDSLDGGDNSDTLHGGQGDDTIIGGAGNDQLHGGVGDDSVLGSGGSDTITGHSGDDSLNGGSGFDSITGGRGNDTIVGSTGNDTLFGNSGDDSLLGREDRDNLFGGTGNDTLNGAEQNDLLNGGTGDDYLIGGQNADTFVFENGFDRDQIEDFSTSSSERIDLSGVSSITNFADLTSNHISQNGTSAIIDAGGGNVITLLGFNIAQFDANDFIF